jgi:hypothetical protein
MSRGLSLRARSSVAWRPLSCVASFSALAHAELLRGHGLCGHHLLRRGQGSSARAWPISRSPAISICCTDGQVQQPQQVAGGAARAAHGLRCLFVRELEFVDQPLQALRLLQRVEVFALDVLDQRHHRGGFVGHLAHQHRHLAQAGQVAAR